MLDEEPTVGASQRKKNHPTRDDSAVVPPKSLVAWYTEDTNQSLRIPRYDLISGYYGQQINLLGGTSRRGHLDYPTTQRLFSVFTSIVIS